MANPPATSTLNTVGRYQRDDNGVPITNLGVTMTNSKTLTGNSTTVHVPIFTVNGQVLIQALWGIVTTVLGANNTAAYWRLNDGSNQSNITVNTGTTLSAAPAGSILVKKDVASAALTLLSASQERVSEPTTLETLYFSPFLAVALPSATTNIEFTYTTTDTPTSGTIQFYVAYVPLTQNSFVTTV